MAQIVTLRRSSVPGKKPTITQIELGELSINTKDGKVFLLKSGDIYPILIFLELILDVFLVILVYNLIKS
jgi:hypothetical protein